ncbi:MAG: protein phosphatase CheZ [Desulfovibrio sp.]|nr:protein phosphatase CheZ [Desulfovibrio sp.]
MTVYKQLSEDMRDGLKDIYRQISSASAEAADKSASPDALFAEASDQLREVARATEEAAMRIMDIIEKQEEKSREASEIIKGAAARLNEGERDRLLALNAELQKDLTAVLTALAFQDLTGQRIRKVVKALEGIEKSVIDLYVSSGLMIEGAEKNPEKDASTLQAEAREAMQNFREHKTSELKGPDRNGKTQSDIDDMLAQLGL